MTLKQIVLKILAAIEAFLPMKMKLAAGIIEWAVGKYLSEDVKLDAPFPLTTAPAEVQTFVQKVFAQLIAIVPNDLVKNLLQPLSDFVSGYLLDKVWDAIMPNADKAPLLMSIEPQACCSPAKLHEFECGVDKILEAHIGA